MYVHYKMCEEDFKVIMQKSGSRYTNLVLTILMINLHDANKHLDLWFYSTFIMVNDNLFLNKEACFQLGNVHFKN